MKNYFVLNTILTLSYIFFQNFVFANNVLSNEKSLFTYFWWINPIINHFFITQSLNSLKSITPLPSLSHSLTISSTDLPLITFTPSPIYLKAYLLAVKTALNGQLHHFRLCPALKRYELCVFHRRDSSLMHLQWIQYSLSHHYDPYL